MASESDLVVPRSIGRHLNLAAGTASAVASALLAPHGLSLAQWAVLVSLWSNGPLGVKQIATLTGNASPATSRIIDRMVTAGLLVRRADDADRRAVVVDLTERGEGLRHLLTIYEEVNAVLLADFTDPEVAQLFALLDRARQAGRAWLDNDAR